MAIQDIYPSGRVNGRVSKEGVPATRSGSASGPMEIAALVWRGLVTILISVAVFVGIAFVYLSIVPARYLASTSLLIDPHLGQNVGADPNPPGFVADGSAIDSQVKLLTSQTVLDRVATATDLGADPEFNGSRRSLIQRLLNPSPALNGKVDLKALEDAITIKRPDRTYVVQIDVLARDPNKAADIANAISRAYIADQVSARIDTATGDSKFVDQRLETLRAEIKDAETKIEAYKTANNVVTTTGLRSNEQQISDLTKVLGDARAKLSDAKARAEEIDRLAKSGRLDASSDALKSITIERLRQQQAEIERQAAKIAATLGERHPSTREIRDQVAETNALIKTELQRLKSGVAGDYRVAKIAEARLVAQVDRLKSQSTRISGTLLPLTQLERNVETLRASSERFAKIKDAITQQQADSPPARVIATARPAVSPSSPKKTLVTLLAAAGGLFFGVAVALFRGGGGAPPAPLDQREPDPPQSRPLAKRRYWDDDDGRA